MRSSSTKPSLQRRLINQVILVIAVIEPVATLPQVVVLYGRHDASGISILTWSVYCLFAAAWTWYGVLEKNWPLVISSVIFGLADIAVVVGALLYGGSW